MYSLVRKPMHLEDRKKEGAASHLFEWSLQQVRALGRRDCVCPRISDASSTALFPASKQACSYARLALETCDRSLSFNTCFKKCLRSRSSMGSQDIGLRLTPSPGPGFCNIETLPAACDFFEEPFRQN